MSVVVLVPYCLNDYSFTIQLEVRACDASCFALLCFFNITLAIRGLLWYHTNFRTVCSSSVKNAGGILIGIALNVYIALGSIDILIVFVLPIWERGCLHFLG